MNTNKKRLATGLCAVAFTCLAGAHVRLIYSANGNVLFWQDPASIGIAFNANGSANVSDGSDLLALRNAVDSWNGIGGTDAQLIEDSSPATQLRTDFDDNDLHLILFDEDGSSGWFPSGTSTVAITPISFFTGGQIIDADILFNGRDYSFTTSAQVGRFDIQDVAAHELGHLLGLDHSGVVGSTLYPYVDPSVILGRSPSVDDIHGIRDMYPSATIGSIVGSVARATGGTPVLGAHVVARDSSGRTVGATITDSSGNYRVAALDPGTYTLWADPLDLPVSAANLTSGHTIETDFSATELGTVAVVGTGTANLGAASVADPVSISLGRVNDDYPLRVIAGDTVTLTVRGAGLVNGSTLTASDTNLALSVNSFSNSFVNFSVTVPGGASIGHVDLLVTGPTGDRDLLPGALEITPPDPVIDVVSPASGNALGGYTVTLTGSEFRSGSRVVIGDRVYVDGQPGGCSVVSASTITLDLNETVAGVHDVVVIDPTGVEGRFSSGFGASGVPTLASLYPVAGSAVGGTELTLTGTNFVSGATVTIDGVPQSQVSVLSSDVLVLQTVPHLAGGPYVLTVQNPDGAMISTAFTYVDSSDPALEAVLPNAGTELGGETVVLVGRGFSPTTQVRFGAHPQTGAGGILATSVEYIDENQLMVVTPASDSNLDTVSVEETGTQQGDVDAGSFTYLGTTVTSIESGACHATGPAGPLSRRDAWNALLWAVMLVGASVVHRRMA